MTATVFLTELQASGVTLAFVAPDRLRVEAPCGVVTPELRAALAQHKLDIIAELRRRQQDAQRLVFFRELGRHPDAWREFETQMEERASIMEIDDEVKRYEALAQAEMATYEEWLN